MPLTVPPISTQEMRNLAAGKVFIIFYSFSLESLIGKINNIGIKTRDLGDRYHHYSNATAHSSDLKTIHVRDVRKKVEGRVST